MRPNVMDVRYLTLPCLLCLTILSPLYADESTPKTAPAALENDSPEKAPIEIRRVDADITIDGRIDESAWDLAAPITSWWETRPGDNVEPKAQNVARLLYDANSLYAAFEFQDPDPSKIRAPYGDRDNVPQSTDYGGLIIDANNDGKTAQMFLANASGIQYDAINSDVTGEDSAPDYFWDAAARRTPNGWTLEIRVPFSSLRYTVQGDPGDLQNWNILLYRNYPRDYRYQMFSSPLPRDSTCFICNARPLTGLRDLPSGSHWVAAPFITSRQDSVPEGDLGSSLKSSDPDTEIGVDFKWIPNPNTVVDLTVNPDFSQIESDVAQISTNERFALFFPERRPFFLEGADLFQTPIRAVYTRTITAPEWGARVTGSSGKTAYTLLVAEDEGGGSVILPGANSSGFADQDYSSTVAIGRIRRDVGERSFISLLLTDREIASEDGGGYNRLFGPDFQWRPTENDWITGQFLWSQTKTPNRLDLSDQWDGRELEGHALELWYWHDSRDEDWFFLYEDIHKDFRADNGFVSQVDYRRFFGEGGYTFWPEEGNFLRRIRVSLLSEYATDQEGNLLNKFVMPAIGMDGRWNSFFRAEIIADEVRSGEKLFERTRFRWNVRFRPASAFTDFFFNGTLGDEIDFAGSRPGSGINLRTGFTLRPGNHLRLDFRAEHRRLDLDGEITGRQEDQRLFTAEVARLRGVYTFNARMFLRLIGQWVETERDPALFADEVAPRSGFFSGSALFAYKLNWQTVLFLGYGDNRELDPFEDLQQAENSIFLKVSYAFQR